MSILNPQQQFKLDLLGLAKYTLADQEIPKPLAFAYIQALGDNFDVDVSAFLGIQDDESDEVYGFPHLEGECSAVCGQTQIFDQTEIEAGLQEFIEMVAAREITERVISKMMGGL